VNVKRDKDLDDAVVLIETDACGARAAELRQNPEIKGVRALFLKKGL